MDEIKEKEKILQQLRTDNEVEDQKLSLAQKKAMEAKIKQDAGTNSLVRAKKILGIFGGTKETLLSSHSMGGGHSMQEIRDLSNLRKRK